MKFDRRIAGAEKLAAGRKQPEPDERTRAHDELITRANNGDPDAMRQAVAELSDAELDEYIAASLPMAKLETGEQV